MRKIPKGTTIEQWERYDKDKADFETHMRAKEPRKEQYSSEKDFNDAYSEWHKAYFMDAPNKPGYYRANND